MKKFISCILAALAILMVFTSCAESEDTASMRIVLDRNTSRLIAPADFPLEVKKYRIDGTGPNNEKISITTAKSSATLDGLTIGQWTLKATGLNEKNAPIVQGSTTFNLSASNTTCTIMLGELVGQGNLSVSLKWDKARVVAPTITLELKKQGVPEPTQLHASMNEPLGTATLTEDKLASGSYILIGKLHSQNVLVSGFVEAVRIVEGKTSHADIEFSLDMFPSAPGSIQLINEAGLPVYCTIKGLTDEVSAGEPRSISLEPEDETLKEVTVDWYVDGTYQATGMNYEMTPEPGLHRLDAVAYTDKIGSYGSTGMNFSAVVNTEKGVPGNRFSVGASNGLKLGGSTLVHFLPNGNFLLFSKANSSMQLCAISRSTVNVLAEWTAADFEFLNGNPVECLSRTLDSDNITIMVTANNPAKTYHLNYNLPSETMTFVEDDRGVVADIGPYLNMFVETFSTDMAFYDEVHGTFDFIGKTIGYFDGIYFRMVKGKEACGDWFSYDFTDFNAKFMTCEPHLDFKNMTAFASTYDGRTYLVGNADAQIYYILNKPDGRVTTGNTNISTTKYKGLDEMEATKDDWFILKGPSFLSSVDSKTFAEKCYLNESGLGDIEFNDATDMLYGIDKSTGSISVYTVNPATGAIALKTSVAPKATNIDRLCFSPGGSYLIAYNKNNGDSLDIFRINTNN